MRRPQVGYQKLLSQGGRSSWLASWLVSDLYFFLSLRYLSIRRSLIYHWMRHRKYHKLRGRIIGHFLISMLNESLDQLASFSLSFNGTTQEYLEHLNTQDKDDEELWKTLPLSSPHGRNADDSSTLEKMPTSLYKGHSMCSSAILPSDERYNGLVNGIKGNVNGINGLFDTGIDEKEAQKLAEAMSMEGRDVPLPVVHSPDHTKTMCPKYGERDYKDYFYIAGLESTETWHTMTIPNDAEYDAFATEAVSTENHIMVCLEVCSWGKCPPGFVKFDNMMRREGVAEGEGVIEGSDVAEGEGVAKGKGMTIYVDDTEVTGVRKLGQCNFLLSSENDKGTWMSKGSKPGQYTIKIRLDIGGFMRIQSFTVLSFVEEEEISEN
uniref:Uncharacterized protein n=1 Tax=Corethron hystrix TaxID=216773 RepID=A0A7S1B666_9STRA|mmetsp:Transcript_13912/g.30561  ORF Transcript_13912/g.30561 Transcript_13912/m.30561 type:complete len:379 (+) Transcript_13912:1171-2307(+)